MIRTAFLVLVLSVLSFANGGLDSALTRLCSSRESLNLCRDRLDSVPLEQLMKYLKLLDETDNLRFTEQEVFDTVYTAVVENPGCMDKWNEELDKYKKEIYTKKNAAGVNRFLGISVYSYYSENKCDLSSRGKDLEDSLSKCYNMVYEFVENKRNTECLEKRNMNVKNVRDVAVYPFRSLVAKARDYLMGFHWTGMNKEWLENIELVSRYEPIKFEISDYLRDGKNVPVDWAVASCLMKFGYSNQTKEALQLNLPSCKDLLTQFKRDCRYEGEEISRSIYLNNNDVVESYVCSGGVFIRN